MKKYKDSWGKLGNWEHHKYIVDELAKSKLPVFLGLLGGEPTLHQRFFELVGLIIEKVLKHADSRLYITTNGSKPAEFYSKLPDSNGKIYMLWSLHPEYVTEETFPSFLANIKLMHSKGYKTKINLMLHPGKKHWEKTKFFYEQLNALDYAILHPHFIYHGFDRKVNYKKEFYEFFSFLENQRLKEFEFTDIHNNKHILTDYEIFDNQYNQFKGWNCWQNNFEIDNFGRVTDRCFHKNSDIYPGFFEEVTEIKPKTCPHNFCSCDGLMKIYKERPNAAL